MKKLSDKTCEKCFKHVSLKTEYYCINHDLPIICFDCNQKEKRSYFRDHKKEYFKLEVKKYNISNRSLR
jgi:hypothetical protein